MKFFKKRKSLLAAFFTAVILAGGIYVFTSGVFTNSHALSSGKENIDTKGALTATADGVQQYHSDHYGFSFKIPKDFSVGEFDEGGGRVVLVHTGANETAFQVFITPYDEPASSLTAERIHEDLPDLSMQGTDMLPMTGGEKALTFIGVDSSFGNTREVWMVHDGFLLQIMTYVDSEEALANILETWELF